MKKQKLLKTLLVAVGLCAGASAWADTGSATVKMTYVDYSNADTSFGEIATGETARAGYNKAPSEGGTVGFANTGWGVNYITYLQVDASTLPDGATITNATLTFDQSGSTDGKRTTGVGAGYNTSTWSSTMTYNTADKTIYLLGGQVWTSTKSETTFENKSIEITKAFAGDDDNIVTILLYETAAAGCYIKNPAVSITYTTQAAANYTIKYIAEIDGVETELKASRSETGIVGESAAIVESDQAAITYKDWRYLYSSNNASETTIASDGSSVVKVVFRAATKKNYTVTSTYKDAESNSHDLAWTSSGFIWEDQSSADIYFPFYQLYNGNTLVTRDRVSNELKYTATIANDGDVVNVEYKAAGIENIYLLSEAEDLGTGLTESATSFTNRVSGRKLIYGASGTLLSLPAGKYIVTLCVAGKPNNSNTTYQAFAGSEQIITDYNSEGNYINNAVSSAFTIYGTTPITFTCAGSSTDRGIDIVYVQKTGDVELPANATATLGKNGYATFASAYDLDLSNLSGVKAYTASLSGNELSFTECTDKVVAGTGLLLKGTADAEVSIPVATADAAAVAGNALTGVTAATDLKSDAESNYIFVMKKAENAAEELTFLPLATESVTVPAGKAYVTVAASEFAESRSLSIKFSDETTAISKVQNAEVANGSYYNLNGQRVATPAKGLYIVNGKKVIVNN